MKYDALDKISELKDKGILTEEEFANEKAKILKDGNDEVKTDVAKIYWGNERGKLCYGDTFFAADQFFYLVVGVHPSHCHVVNL